MAIAQLAWFGYLEHFPFSPTGRQRFGGKKSSVAPWATPLRFGNRLSMLASV
jgi:hypothetical protein